MPPGVRVSPGVLIPGSAFEVRTARSSGPGGQNVNKVASKIDLRVDLARIQGLPEEARRRLERATEGRRDAQGRLRLVSQASRDQHRNLRVALDRLRHLVARALVPPRRRRPTRPSRASVERRLSDKKRRAARKRERRGSEE